MPFEKDSNGEIIYTDPNTDPLRGRAPLPKKLKPKLDTLPLLLAHLSAAEKRLFIYNKRYEVLLRAWREQLTFERKKKEMSQRQLAKAMNISAAFLCDMEHGNRIYTLAWGRRAMKVLQSDLNYPK